MSLDPQGGPGCRQESWGGLISGSNCPPDPGEAQGAILTLELVGGGGMGAGLRLHTKAGSGQAVGSLEGTGSPEPRWD